VLYDVPKIENRSFQPNILDGGHNGQDPVVTCRIRQLNNYVYRAMLPCYHPAVPCGISEFGVQYLFPHLQILAQLRFSHVFVNNVRRDLTISSESTGYKRHKFSW